MIRKAAETGLAREALREARGSLNHPNVPC
jgi:hypothetical protein